jgi:hypothetical protein
VAPKLVKTFSHSKDSELLVESARFEVLKAVSLKMQVVWDVVPCRLVNSYRMDSKFVMGKSQ